MVKKVTAPKVSTTDTAPDMSACITDHPAPMIPVNGLRITSARNGFRRAGRAWSSEPTEVLLSEFSPDQLAMLRAESMLTIEEILLP